MITLSVRQLTERPQCQTVGKRPALLPLLQRPHRHLQFQGRFALGVIISFSPRIQALAQIFTGGFTTLALALTLRTVKANTASHLRFKNSESYT